jgi:hypothetical protein
MQKARSRRNFIHVWKRDEERCQYCGEPGDCIDHIVPWSHTRDNGMGNLVVACALCNALAWNLVFPSFEIKRDFILRGRQERFIRQHRPVGFVPPGACEAPEWCEAYDTCWLASEWRPKPRECEGRSDSLS